MEVGNIQQVTSKSGKKKLLELVALVLPELGLVADPRSYVGEDSFFGCFAGEVHRKLDNGVVTFFVEAEVKYGTLRLSFTFLGYIYCVGQCAKLTWETQVSSRSKEFKIIFDIVRGRLWGVERAVRNDFSCDIQHFIGLLRAEPDHYLEGL